jgi:hypothetical protein
MQVGDIIDVNDKMQSDCSYELVAPMGKDFSDRFQPFHTPKEMLAMGVFEGKYCNDCIDKFPADWFQSAKLRDTPDASVNYFGIKSRQPLSAYLLHASRADSMLVQFGMWPRFH